MTTKRQVSYQWRLREVMAEHGMFVATDLAPKLAERGTTLSAVQGVAAGHPNPERQSLPVLAALCDIFDCQPGHLIATRAQDVTVRRAAGQAGNVVDLATTMRPKRARITGE